MQWSDSGIIIGTRRHGESSLIVELMTRGHGRHLGIVRGGRSRRMQPVLQPGNHVEATWRARLDEHLGMWAIEPVSLKAADLLAGPVGVFGIQMLAAHLRLLPERDPHAALYEALGVLIDHLDNPALAGPLMVRFEMNLLDELGFGLDLSKCAATGRRDDLVYVSPKSGRAVSREAGAPWRDKLLALPDFLTRRAGREAGADAIADAFRLTAHFLARDVWMPRGVAEPAARSGFVAAVLRAIENPQLKETA
ncbi:MAG TPA: DNA repair protein RecO [Rhizobiaceae bacterium]|nr:DNA repair protein RecO [Rhizobiaceae bacterium]